MGYLTENLIAESVVFQSKIAMALTVIVDNALGGPDDEVARVVMQDIPRYARELAPRLSTVSNLTLDSTDAEIDSGVLASIPYLKARTLKT